GGPGGKAAAAGAGGGLPTEGDGDGGTGGPGGNGGLAPGDAEGAGLYLLSGEQSTITLSNATVAYNRVDFSIPAGAGGPGGRGGSGIDNGSPRAHRPGTLFHSSNRGGGGLS